ARNLSPDLPDSLSRRRDCNLCLAAYDAMAKQHRQSRAPEEYHLKRPALHEAATDPCPSHEFGVAFACREHDRAWLEKRACDFHLSAGELEVGKIVREDPLAVRGARGARKVGRGNN